MTALISELQKAGALGQESRSVPILVEQSSLFPKAAANYNPGDVIQFRTGSEQHGIARDSSATVVAVEPTRNHLTVLKADREEVSYNPALLRPANIYREERRDIASGPAYSLHCVR